MRTIPFRLASMAGGVLLAIVVIAQAVGQQDAPLPDDASNARYPASDVALRRWLENMVWHHQFSSQEITAATGLSAGEVEAALLRLGIWRDHLPAREPAAPLRVLPYPGGRHPRIGFLDGALRPQRETKVSVFTPWDPRSYVVLDVPEAIWSNLGLTYLAHTHVPTIWSQRNVELPRLEWHVNSDESLVSQRTLPNGITFGTRIVPRQDQVQMEMWLHNRSGEDLTDLRVQNCVLLKGAKGFAEQTNDNKFFSGAYAACHDHDHQRWIITAWDPPQRTWANAPCPCLHADPAFPDCPRGETRSLRGWLSFYEGDDIDGELDRIEATGWRNRPVTPLTGTSTTTATEAVCRVTGEVTDAASGRLLPARLYVRDERGGWHFAHPAVPAGSAVPYRKQPSNLPGSVEMHTTLSAHPFGLELPPGNYTFRVERGKEYFPEERTVAISRGTARMRLEIPLRRWIDMAERGWFSGDTHVHRSLAELPNVMLAEDLNVALPLTYWVRQAGVAPTAASPGPDPPAPARPIPVDPTHVIYPLNTEYELFTVEGRAHTLGAVFVLNHRSPLPVAAPPAAGVAQEARRQGAILDLDKHSWPWSLMLVPVMGVDLFEIANNHHWRTRFGFRQWALSSAADYMNLEQDADGFTEWGWTDFGLQTYYGLLNCGYRLRVTAGTASGVHPVPLGFGRVYVHLPEGFSYQAWISGLNAGRSFVTTGPMLEATFNDSDPGHRQTVTDAANATVTVQGRASSQHPLDRVEIIVSGQVARRIEPANEPSETGALVSPFLAEIALDGTAWIAVRCFERHPAGRVRMAHTNPAHVDMPGKPLRPRREEVTYFVRRMQEELERNRSVLDAQSLAEYEAALARHQSLLSTAR
jgi:hypothetical protein